MAALSARSEKVNLLNEEIAQGIKNLSDEPVATVTSSLDSIRSSVFEQDRISPETEYALQLFRKYADLANDIKDRASGRGEFAQAGTGSAVLDALPQFVYESHREEFAGQESFRKNIFWYRFVIFLLALTVFLVIVTVPAMEYQKLKTTDITRHESYNCMYKYSLGYGQFDMVPYRALAGITLLMLGYNLFFCVYYMLPLDEDKHKYIPGVETCFLSCGIFNESFVKGAKSRWVTGNSNSSSCC